MMDRDLMTTREACDYLKVHRDTLRRLRVPCVYVGARKRYRRTELDKVARRRPKATRTEAA